MIRLINVYECILQDRRSEGMDTVTATEKVLYEIMEERPPEANISHKEMPTIGEHIDFVRSIPYQYWYLIELVENTRTEPGQIGPVSNSEGIKVTCVGSIYLTKAREVGIFIFKQYQDKGLARQAIKLLREKHPGKLLANISPLNGHSQHVFQRLGFRLIQYTYVLEEETHGQT